ncbi:hypothetical protein GGI25_005388 [Coemansia spiralis]|uniref:Myb transcription factor n=2 Tax=Coemansia TaxID=4863 RepID=A0A9W8G3X5_9FUNG|nr:hypothetical protein EDC05_003591 [Coemansia umbellata]KAJ2621198.1 hypothetical protein GGI26_004367 [Coemansia sp. RSA 1358]KAJ2671697.1 hypothetical protein GGI25_005388 [Coemansia spiralis]
MVGSSGPKDKERPESATNGSAEAENSNAALDIESTKRNLQALVAAGIHAQGLLGQDGINDDEDEDDSSDESIEDGQQDDLVVAGYEDEEEVVSGNLLSSDHRHYLVNEQHTHIRSSTAGYGLERAGSLPTAEEKQHQNIAFDNLGQQLQDDAELRSAQLGSIATIASEAEESHHELLSRVANNFRALISHGLATASKVEGSNGIGENGASLDDEEAYTLACETLGSNLRYQRILRSQLTAIDTAQKRNKELQESIGTLLTIQARATNRRGGRRNKDDRSGQVDPVTNELKISATNFFTDANGERPPENRDIIRKRKHPPIVYRARRWTDAEREALAQGVRQSNRKILSQRLFQQTKDPRSMWEVDKMPDHELEMNLAGLDWKYISKQFVPQHKPVECAIQWATQDHPIINRAPWTKKEEKMLKDIVEKNNGRDWVTIAKELNTQRTASQCFQVYQRKLNPDMSRSKWTPEEDRVLTEAVMTYGEGDWQAVAACLDNRTGQQVLHRWCKSINPAIRSGRWDRDEDIALLAAVRLYGVGQWTKISKHVPGRTDVKCRERYMNVLTPDVNNSQWTTEEDDRLIAIVNRVGIGKWSYVADLLGGRTDNQCWRHWRSLHKKGRAPDPPEDVEDESGVEEGTVPSFPEWEEERRRRRNQQNQNQHETNGDIEQPQQPSASTDGAGHDDESLLNFAHTQGNGRKRKTTSGIESARKRQWKRATSTNFVPLLASPPSAEKQPGAADTTAKRGPPRSLRAKSTGSIMSRNTFDGEEAFGDYSLEDTPTRAGSSMYRSGRASYMDPLASPSSVSGNRRVSALRRGRALNWSNILQIGVEGKEAENMDYDAHIRPVFPCLGTTQGLQRLLEAVPEVASAFNAELVGVDDDESVPSLDTVPMAWLRQRIETLFIWPLMLGTLDTQRQRQQSKSWQPVDNEE